MYHLQLWGSDWSDLAELDADEPAAPPAEPHARDGLSPKEKYGYLIEYGTQVLCLLTAENGATYFSRNFEKITGHTAAAHMGEKFFELIHPDSLPKLKELLAAGSNGDMPYKLRCQIRQASGQWEWHLLMIRPKQNGHCAERVCIMENIHENIQTQSTLTRAKLEAELALRARSEFLANMSHDLRTPLNAVIGFAQMMESQVFGTIENPHYQEYIRHIQESGHELLAKIEDLFEIANIDVGRHGLNREDVALNDITRHVLGAMAHQVSAAGVTLSCMPPESGLKLHVDRIKLQHILGHLLSNAIRHSKKGGAVLLETGLTDKQELLIRIRDNGRGMSREKLDHILSALKNESYWTAKGEHSIGLGLALTKEFVALHGGSIKIISKEQVGTTVYITLPKECVCTGTHATHTSRPRIVMDLSELEFQGTD